jgi:hypothetical protein
MLGQGLTFDLYNCIYGYPNCGELVPNSCEEIFVQSKLERKIGIGPRNSVPHEKKKATFNLDADLHQRLKVVAAIHRREMGALVEEALQDLLRRLELKATSK